MPVVSLDALSQRRALLDKKRELGDARRRLERTENALESLRNVLSLLPDAVEVIGEDLLVHFANRASIERHGQNPEGKPYHTLLPGRDHTPDNCPVRTALRENREVRSTRPRSGGGLEETVITPTRLAGGQNAVVRCTRPAPTEPGPGGPPADCATPAAARATSESAQNGAQRATAGESAPADGAGDTIASAAPAPGGSDTTRVEQWRDVEALRDWSAVAAQNTNTGRMLTRLLPRLGSHFRARRILYYRLDPHARRFVLDGESSASEMTGAPSSLSGADYRTLERAGEADVPYVRANQPFEALPGSLADVMRRDRSGDCIVLPVRSALALHGVVVIASRDTFPLRGGDDKLLRALSQLLGSAIERNTLIRTLKRNAATLVELQRAGMSIVGAQDLATSFERLGRSLVTPLGFAAVRTRITGEGLPADGFLHSFPGPFQTAGELSEAIVDASANALARDEIEILDARQTLRLVVDRGHEAQLARCRSVTVVPVRVNSACFGVIQLFSAHSRDELIAMKPVVRTFVRHAETALRQQLAIRTLRDELERSTHRTDIAGDVVAHVRTPIAVISPDGRITLTNPAFLDLLGCEATRVPRLRDIVFSGRVGPGVGDRELARGLLDRAPLHDNECFVNGADGERIPVELSAVAVRGGGELLLTFRDVRAERKLRAQLSDALKLSLAGERIASLTHQVNNYLTPAFYHAEQLAADPSLDPSSRRAVDTIQNYLNLCHESITMVLQIIRPAVPGPVRINELIEETLSRHCAGVSRGTGVAVLETHFDDSAPVTTGYRVQLQQAIANIVSNAQEAIADSGWGGRIVIRTEATPATIRIEIEDDGPGMSEDIAEHAFDLGVTGKAPGAGTGVGLHFVREVVRQHMGTVSMRTSPGRGTHFTIRLPVRDPGAPDTSEGPDSGGDLASPPGDIPGNPMESPGQDPAETRPAPRTGRLLVVDDEPAILELLVDILGPQGHSVTIAANADDAVEAVEAGEFDCIICDIRMPGMDGSEFSEILRIRYPDLYPRLVFATGDLFSDDTDRFLRDSGIPLVEKPFTADSVQRAVQSILAGTRDE